MAFSSAASNLNAGDTDSLTNVFASAVAAPNCEWISNHDPAITTPVTPMDGTSTTSQCVSQDGRYVVFTTQDALVPQDTNNSSDVYLRDRLTGQVSLVSVSQDGTTAGNGWSYSPAISADGSMVAFFSSATNLCAGGNGHYQIYVRNMVTGVTSLVSVASDGKTAGNGES